jgi:hypothetical protein
MIGSRALCRPWPFFFGFRNKLFSRVVDLTPTPSYPGESMLFCQGFLPYLTGIFTAPNTTPLAPLRKKCASLILRIQISLQYTLHVNSHPFHAPSFSSRHLLHI